MPWSDPEQRPSAASLPPHGSARSIDSIAGNCAKAMEIFQLLASPIEKCLLVPDLTALDLRSRLPEPLPTLMDLKAIGVGKPPDLCRVSREASPASRRRRAMVSMLQTTKVRSFASGGEFRLSVVDADFGV
jgi:hypothetical protein